MRLLSGIAIAMVIAWTVTQPSPAGAQNFDDRFSIIPKANAAEPSGENKEVPQTEPADVPQTQPAQSQPPGEGRSTSGSEDRSTTRASKRNFTASKRSFTGRASYYSYRTGKTASGSLFNRDLPTAAHRSLPFGTRVRVTDLATRKSVIVTITDRGPRVPGRMLDLSLAAARTLGMTERGVVNVRVEVLQLASGDARARRARARWIGSEVYSGLRHFAAGCASAPTDDIDEYSTLFPGTDIDHVVQTIREEAVFVGLNLPAGIVADIEAFARSEPLHAIYDPEGASFRYSDIVRGRSADGRSMPIGGIREPSRCAAVKAIVNDPVLRAIVRGYLGHEPRRVMTILDWSFASDITDQERRRLKHHVIDYHYDDSGFNFVYASFYITDTHRTSGAHVMMKRSHRKKPLRMLLGSTVASETDVRRQFGIENEITIEGPAGTGFVQDTSCYHRATPPTHGDRLMLAVRFIN